MAGGDDDKNGDDWNFKIDENSLKNESEEAKKEISRKKSKLAKARRKKENVFELDTSTLPPQKIKRRGQYVEEKKEILIPTGKPIDRLISLTIDLIPILLLSYFLPQFFSEHVPLLGEIIKIDSADPSFVNVQLMNYSRIILLVLFYFLLIVFPLGIWNQTIGLKIKKIRIEHVDGGYVRFGKILVRQTIGLALHIGLVIPWFIPFFDKKARGLHDLIAGTMCVAEEAPNKTEKKKKKKKN